MVHFVGAGPGGPDLITLRGAQLLGEAGCVIYAGSLVNPALLAMTREGASIYNSAQMTLEQVLAVIREMEQSGKTTVRLHTGDPCLYGAIQEQMDQLDELGISWDVTPGVSSFCGAAAAVGTEYTLPGVSQSVIITRLAGRTPVRSAESLASLARHGATMVIFLSAGMLAQELHAMADAPAEEKRQRLTIDVTALEGLTMTADYAALTRVLTNLLSNAVKYTQRGGRVSLAAALCQAEGLAHAIFTVEDNGMGMTPAFMERMYQPFERARESAHLPGSGLGLSIVRRLAAGMGGEIRVQSACGRGTTFTVRVPLDISPLQ